MSRLRKSAPCRAAETEGLHWPAEGEEGRRPPASGWQRSLSLRNAMATLKQQPPPTRQHASPTCHCGCQGWVTMTRMKPAPWGRNGGRCAAVCLRLEAMTAPYRQCLLAGRQGNLMHSAVTGLVSVPGLTCCDFHAARLPLPGGQEQHRHAGRCAGQLRHRLTVCLSSEPPERSVQEGPLQVHLDGGGAAGELYPPHDGGAGPTAKLNLQPRGHSWGRKAQAA